MKLSVAYNRKSLINEDYVAIKLRLYWKEVNKGYVWRSIVDFFDGGIRVWISLSYGYEEKSKKSLFYSSFGIDYGHFGAYHTIRAHLEDHCWGTDCPGPWEVICFYREEIRKVLFKSGPRNKRVFSYPNKKGVDCHERGS